MNFIQTKTSIDDWINKLYYAIYYNNVVNFIFILIEIGFEPMNFST